MYAHRTRPTHHEEYREFFSILASGDRTQYARAQQVLPPSPPSSPTSAIFAPRLWSAAQIPNTVEDSSDESDDSSATAVEIAIPDDLKSNVKAVDVLIEEVPLVRAAVAHSPIPPSEASVDSSAAAVDIPNSNDAKFVDMPIKEVPRVDATAEDCSPSSPPDALNVAIPSSPLMPAVDAPHANSPLDALESSASAVTSSNEELRTGLKQLLRRLYDIETFRGAVREVLKESKATFQPLKDSSAALPAVAAPTAADPIFTLTDDKPAHMPKKRRLPQTPAPAEEKAGFKGAQHLMDVVSDMMAAHRPGWKKLRKSLSKSWPKPKSAKKRVYTELESEEACS